VGSEFIHVDEQTDMSKLIVTFRDFEKTHKKKTILPSLLWQRTF